MLQINGAGKIAAEANGTESEQSIQIIGRRRTVVNIWDRFVGQSFIPCGSIVLAHHFQCKNHLFTLELAGM